MPHSPAPPPAARRPNIVSIVIDDLGWADLACYGSDFYETPRLDRLATRGVRFTDAYATCPVCSPTRASLLTGRYPARVGITNWIAGNPWGRLMGVPYFDALPRSERTAAQYLADAGYRTHHVGKWHLGGEGHGPRDFGFHTNVGGCHMGAPRSYFSPYGIPALDDPIAPTEEAAPEYLTDRLTDEALAVLARHSSGGPHADTPFFLNLWHYAVHTPLQAPAPLVEKYAAKATRLSRDPNGPLVPGEAFPCLHKKDLRVMRRAIQSHPVYAAMIENLDTNIGRVLDALENTGLDTDTLVVFTSDNGGLATAEGSPTCNAPLSEGKGWMADGGNRVCLIAAGAGVHAPGRVCDTPVSSADLLPTLLDLAGVIPTPDTVLDGRSLAPLLSSDPLPEAPLFWHYPHYSNQGGTPACAIRRGRFKLIETFEDARLQLYDLQDDPGETQNLAAQEPGRAARLHAELQAWRANVGAQIPSKNPDHSAMHAGRIPAPDAFGRVPGDDR